MITEKKKKKMPQPLLLNVVLMQLGGVSATLVLKQLIKNRRLRLKADERLKF